VRVSSLLILASSLVLLSACGRRHRDDDHGQAHVHADGQAHDHGDDQGRQAGDQDGGAEFGKPRERRNERRDDRADARVEDRTGWDKLGECVVDGKADKDKIHVGRDDGSFTRIKLVAEHSALELWDVEVQFGDGSKWSPQTRLVFDRNTTSRVIDLPGGARSIKKVEFRYGNLPGGGRAQLELWAR
jgi:hypothetical protein